MRPLSLRKYKNHYEIQLIFKEYILENVILDHFLGVLSFISQKLMRISTDIPTCIVVDELYHIKFLTHDIFIGLLL